MIDGGQQITSIEQHLLQGSELFDTDPKGALAAYYQAVSLEPTHVEGWNQIGRLMFDMQQYSEAEMVFKRVEQLSLQQGLGDWAEMAGQNIELTRQTVAEMPSNDQSAPEPHANDAEQGDLGQAELASELAASEEHQSIADISNIASATSLPMSDETQLLQPETVREIVEETTNADQNIEAQTLAVMAEPAIASPIMKATAQTIEVLDEPARELALASPSVAIPSVPIPSVAIEPAVMPAVSAEPTNSAPIATPDPRLLIANPTPIPVVPAQYNPSEISGQYAPAISPIAPAAQIPFGQHHQQAANIPADMQAAVPLPDMAMPAQPGLPEGQSGLSPMAPPMPFPAHSDAVLVASMAGDRNPPQTPSMVPPTPDAAMDAPKSSSGKIALMITGVVGAVGIGIGAAQYLNTSDKAVSTVPVIKSEAKLPSKKIVRAVVVPESDKVDTLAAPAPASVVPQSLDQDRAYRVGMTHLVKGEFTQARPLLETAANGGHAEAAFNLASLYAKGDGVDQNYKTAASYLEKASNDGYYPAMTNLGLLYAKGQGVKQNYLTARSLWLKAAAGEHADAMHNLAVIYATGKGVEKDMGEAINWYRKGANGGYVDSIFDLGLLYANGDGVKRDFAEAKRLWETAAGKGHKLAAKNLEKLKQVMAQ